MLQVIAIFALIASLIFVGLQIKQTQEIGRGEAAAYYLESINSFRNTIIENSEVWRTGCMDEELSDGDQTRFAQMYNEYFSTIFWYCQLLVSSLWRTEQRALPNVGSSRDADRDMVLTQIGVKAYRPR